MGFCCPICKKPLSVDSKSFVCENRHCYDRSKSGYVNLLLSQSKKGTRHGDDKSMVNARREFLKKDFYLPFAEAVADTAALSFPDHGVLLDCGCGEGYYTEKVVEAFKKAGKNGKILGIDISKDALNAAGKRGIFDVLAVASAYRLPLLDESCDMVITLFAPVSEKEIFRVLKPNGVFLFGAPLKRHLFSLKAAIYDHSYENEEETATFPSLRLENVEEIKGKIWLRSKEDIENLFRMTPYYYKTGRKDQEKIEGLSSLEVETEFGLFLYRKPKDFSESSLL